MTTTPKISVIDRNTRENREESQVKAQQIDTREKSSYAKQTKNEWKAMTSSSPINEMLNEINGVAQQAAYACERDAIMDSLVINNPLADLSYRTEHELPEVPMLNDLFRENPSHQANMEPLVERYEALQVTLEDLYDNCLYALKQPMDVSEVTSTQEYYEDIVASLALCKEQLEQSKYYLYLQRYNEKQQRLKLEAEGD